MPSSTQAAPAGPARSNEESGPAPLAPARPYWLGLGVIAIGVVWLLGASQLPQVAQYAAIGPGLFVTIIGAALVLLGGLLILQIARGERFEPQDAEDALANTPASWPALITATAAAALPLVTIWWLGLPLTAALSFALVARAFGSRRFPLDLAIGAALGLIAFYGFSKLGVTLGGFLPVLGL